jgi:hypothetical protein
MTGNHPLPRNIVWSTDHLNMGDPFQRRWYLRQVLMHGRAEDVQALDRDEIARELDELNLPPEIYTLWQRALEKHHAER